MEQRHITISKFTSPQWDHRPDQIQLALFLLGVLVNPHMFMSRDPEDLPEEKRALFRLALEADLALAQAGELPPAEETEDDNNPFAEFLNSLDLPEEKKDKR